MPNVFTSLYTTGHSFPRCTWNNQISYHSISHGDHHVCPYVCRYHFLHTSWQWICELVFTSEQLDYCYAILTLRLVLFSVWILITSRTLSFRKRSQQTMMTVLVFVANFPLRIWLVFNVIPPVVIANAFIRIRTFPPRLLDWIGRRYNKLFMEVDPSDLVLALLVIMNVTSLLR